MFAAAVRIDRSIEADIGRVVAGDDLAGGIDRYRGFEWRKFVETLPSVVEGNPRLSLETSARVGLRAAATAPLAFDRTGQFGKIGRRTRRFGGRRDRRVLEGM